MIWGLLYNLLNKTRNCLVCLFVSIVYISICVLFVYQFTSRTVILDNILKTGKIRVITRNNSHCYYVYRDQSMGFEYDLAKAFADYLGVKLEIIIAEKWDEMISALMDGRGELIAASMTITPKREKQVVFSSEYMATQQYIIVHRDNRDIKKAEDLAGKTVHVKKGTSYQEQLEVLKREGIALTIEPQDNTPAEELIQQVAEKAIEVTVADKNIALLNRRYYPSAVLACSISEREQLAWAVNANAHKLLKHINNFFNTIKENGEFTKIYNKYYADIDLFDYVDFRAYHRRLATRLPLYVSIIQKAAKKYDFDWRLIASQIYQESHFDPEATSFAGAYGLMQLAHSTAESLGVNDIFDPEQNINAGVQHLRMLYNYFNKAYGWDRFFIALATYNVGQGHMLDARNLAREMGLDPNKWSSLVITLPLLESHQYYKKAKYGYCRGKEPINYVKQIMIYYDILKRRSLVFNTDNQSKQKL
ncbi:MAG: membrane-bound lytic murein transglycosylase MltF [Deltaproteobacteria bacterium]|nr:membrane-bound lytic murein transglycosylase MltF [Deltaproteobacteria bacterium]MBW2660641.1 membrane-bound lytic murein transglycosylase MltF [Deltaproteobacteria bacterium]